MQSSRLSWLSPFIFVAASALALTGCAGQGDIDRTQPDNIDKSIFFDQTTGEPKVFYYRQTFVGVPVTAHSQTGSPNCSPGGRLPLITFIVKGLHSGPV